MQAAYRERHRGHALVRASRADLSPLEHLTMSMVPYRTSGMTSPSRCFCPPSADKRCRPDDELVDSKGRALCCPHDDERMAAFYGESVAEYRARPSNDGRKSAMRKRLSGVIEEIAQRAAESRKYR